MKIIRFIIRAIIEAYRTIRRSRTSFTGVVLWTVVLYSMIGISAVSMENMKQKKAAVVSTDVYVLVDRNTAGVVSLGERLRNIPGVRSVDFIFPDRSAPVSVTGGDQSTRPFVFFNVRASIAEDSLKAVTDHARSLAGVFDILQSRRQNDFQRSFHDLLRFAFHPLCVISIGLSISTLIILSWIDVDRYFRTIEIMRAFGATRSFAALPCAVFSGIRGVFGVVFSIPLAEATFRFGLFDIRHAGPSAPFGLPVGILILAGILIPAGNSFAIAWIRSAYVFRRS